MSLPTTPTPPTYPANYICPSGLENRIHIDNLNNEIKDVKVEVSEIQKDMKAIAETVSQMRLLVILAGVTIFLNFVEIIKSFIK